MQCLLPARVREKCGSQDGGTVDNNGGGRGSRGYKPIRCKRACPESSRHKLQVLLLRQGHSFSVCTHATPPCPLYFQAGFLPVFDRFYDVSFIEIWRFCRAGCKGGSHGYRLWERTERGAFGMILRSWCSSRLQSPTENPLGHLPVTCPDFILRRENEDPGLIRSHTLVANPKCPQNAAMCVFLLGDFIPFFRTAPPPVFRSILYCNSVITRNFRERKSHLQPFQEPK